jgi:deoxycytidylate deaminase/dephospho-CoA kinase
MEPFSHKIALWMKGRAMSHLIIGLAGSLGSGCTTLSEALKDKRFKRVSISSLIKDKFKGLHPGMEPTQAGYGADWRAELQDIGNRGRKGEFAQGANAGVDHSDYWVNLALSSVDLKNDDIVIAGIRNPGEVESLRRKYPNFWLVAVYADYTTRWNRLKSTGGYPNEAVFQRDDRRDSDEGDRHGQNVQHCVYEADYVLKNVDPIEPPSKVKSGLLARLEEPLRGMRGEEEFRRPLPAEVSMATAVSQSHASQCKQRKVGALIVNEENGIPLSVGYNENPVGMESCSSLYGRCYKNQVIESRLEKMVPFFCPECQKKHDKIGPPYLCDGKMDGDQPCRCNFRRKFFPSRGIELCTAIHAEERAILSLAGRSADGCTIYVNTFPCFQCARQIVNAGIKKVVYVEAYPIEEAVDFLKTNGVEIKPFEGFTPRVFNQVFRQVE